MSTSTFDPIYSAAVRNLLVATAERHPRRRRLRSRRWTISLTLVGISVLGTTAAVAGQQLLPGADINARLGATRIYTGVGTKTIDLGNRPAAANAVSLVAACSGPGSLVFADGSSMSCDSPIISLAGRATTVEAFPAAGSTYRVQAQASTRWAIRIGWVDQTETGLLVNAHGQTYGVDNGRGHPDLIAATATNGRQGYINAKEAAALDQSDPSHFHTPQQAVQWQQDHPGYSVDIPVYLSDGTTKIGIFRIGG